MHRPHSVQKQLPQNRGRRDFVPRTRRRTQPGTAKPKLIAGVAGAVALPGLGALVSKGLYDLYVQPHVQENFEAREAAWKNTGVPALAGALPVATLEALFFLAFFGVRALRKANNPTISFVEEAAKTIVEDATLIEPPGKSLRILEQELKEMVEQWTPEVDTNLTPNRTQFDPIMNGQYQPIRSIGKGGMGEVLIAVNKAVGKKHTDRHVAIKVPGPAASLDRFFQETVALCNVRHPNVMRIIDHQFEEDVREPICYMAEYIRGTDLKKFVKLFTRHHSGQGLPLSYAQLITLKMVDGLAAALEGGVASHRDLKPGNIMLTSRKGLVKVIDFGLAKVKTEGGANLTGTDVVMGTPNYMAPEIAMKGARDVDHRADIYALGLMLYHMLTGKLPARFDTSDRVAFYIWARSDEPTFSQESLRLVPKKTHSLLEALGEKNPDLRMLKLRLLYKQLTGRDPDTKYPADNGSAHYGLLREILLESLDRIKKRVKFFAKDAD